MTIPNLTFEGLKTLLEENGWEIVSNTDWETHNRVMFGKGGHTFPFQIKGVYHYPFIVKLCRSLDIPPPEDHLLCYEQWEKQRNVIRSKKENGD